jgi:phosphoribosylamine--glycine ligase
MADQHLSKVKIIAPSMQAGSLEGSKDFAKDFMEKYNIPTARHKTFTEENIHLADSFLETMTPPYVLKADGLAAGKGVLILNELSEAKREIRSMIIDKKFGKSSSKL